MSGLWKAKGGAQPRGEEENLELLEVIQSARGKKIKGADCSSSCNSLRGYDLSVRPIPSLPCHSIKFPKPIVCYIFQLDLTDGENFWAMEWSMNLERHPSFSMEWRWF